MGLDASGYRNRFIYREKKKVIEGVGQQRTSKALPSGFGHARWVTFRPITVEHIEMISHTFQLLFGIFSSCFRRNTLENDPAKKGANRLYARELTIDQAFIARQVLVGGVNSDAKRLLVLSAGWYVLRLEFPTMTMGVLVTYLQSMKTCAQGACSNGQSMD